MADLHVYVDPVCPFAWMTSKWVRTVAAQRAYDVEWRPISLRLINSRVDYDSHFPAGYEAGHTAGLKLLRVSERVRAEHGLNAVDRFFAACGQQVFEVGPDQADAAARLARGELLPAVLEAAGLPQDLAAALEDTSYDAALQASTDAALALTGKDVGTPILHFEPSAGPQSGAGTAFFGPVISRLPSDEQAVELWDHVIGLARFAGFAELKRSLRELPQLPALGVAADEVGVAEDWHAGSRRQKR